MSDESGLPRVGGRASALILAAAGPAPALAPTRPAGISCAERGREPSGGHRSRRTAFVLPPRGR